MHRIDGPGATPSNMFTEGDPIGGVQATTVTDDWLNAVQEEVISVITAAGIALNKASSTQLLAAINALKATAVLAPQFDNTLAVATTSFVTRAGLQYSPIHTGQATALSTTMTAAHAGSRIYFNNTANQTATLPPTAGLANGTAIHCSKAASSGSGNVTVSSSGGLTNIDTGGGLASSVGILGGEDCVFTWNSSLATWICSGTFMFRLNAFTNQNGLGANGFQKLPGGLIIQWGSATVNTTGSAISFATAYPVAALAVVALPSDPTSTTAILVANLTGSKTSFGLRSNVAGGVAGTWISLGI